MNHSDHLYWLRAAQSDALLINAKRQAEKRKPPIFNVFGVTRSGIEPGLPHPERTLYPLCYAGAVKTARRKDWRRQEEHWADFSITQYDSYRGSTMGEELFRAFVSKISMISMLDCLRNMFAGHTYLLPAPSRA